MQTYQNAGTYTGEAVYEDGKAGKAIRLGDYGLKLNVGNVGENYSVSLWVNPSEALKEHGALLFASAPKGASELWTSLSGNNSGKLKPGPTATASAGPRHLLMSHWKITSGHWLPTHSPAKTPPYISMVHRLLPVPLPVRLWQMEMTSISAQPIGTPCTKDWWMRFRSTIRP